MFWLSLVLGFFSTLLLWIITILIKWVTAELGILYFVLFMFLLTSICILATGGKNYDEDEGEV